MFDLRINNFFFVKNSAARKTPFFQNLHNPHHSGSKTNIVELLMKLRLNTAGSWCFMESGVHNIQQRTCNQHVVPNRRS